MFPAHRFLFECRFTCLIASSFASANWVPLAPWLNSIMGEIKTNFCDSIANSQKKERCLFSHVKGLGRAAHVAGWHYTLVEKKKPYCIISFAQVMQIRVVLNGTKTGSGHLLLPATLPTHGAFWADGKRITTTPLCLLVSLMAGAGEHHSPECLALAEC